MNFRFLNAEYAAESIADKLASSGGAFKFEPANFVENLKYMGLGMLGIFIVIGVINGVTAILNKFFKE